VEVLQLPPLASPDDRFSGLVDDQGQEPGPGLWEARRDLLLATVRDQHPVVLLTEMYPFGRRAFRHEVNDLLDAARKLSPRPLFVSTVRDVLVSKSKPERWLEMRDIALQRYDLVLVHGDPALFPFGASFPHAADLGSRLVHTGFVLSPSRPAPTGAPRDTVVISAGGGAVGSRLLKTALAARPHTRLAEAQWRLVGGQNLPPEIRDQLRREMPADVVLDGHRNDLPALMAAAEVCVCQAGYNTVVEGLAHAARLVLVPFDSAGQDEQRARAERLRDLGLAQLVHPAELDPVTLAAAIDHGASLPRPAIGKLSFDGAERSARMTADRVRHALAA
jgi:predicted glycosyltransferase